MKKLLLLCLAMQLLFIAFAFSQKTWERYAGNPVLELGPTGSWDSESAEMGTVLLDGTIYHLWYSGFDGVHYRIGHATSQDGISWTKDPLNPVLDVGAPGSWDESSVYIPAVLLNGTTYHMWYDGAWGNIECVGHATSSDGSVWTKDPMNPVLDVGPTGSWDDFQVFPMAGSVIFEDNTYKMWYGGGNTSWVWNIGYATSTDGCTWTKEPSNPVMGVGNAGEWDDYSVIPATVLPNEAGYQMWFSGCNIENRWRVGYATSPDGLVWTKYPCNPVLDYGSAGSWDHYQAWNASILYDDIGQQYKMWYTGGDYYAGRLGYAISPSSNIIHVPCDYLTIQEGINAASQGDTILVANGTWHENIRFMGKAITVSSPYILTSDSSDIYNTIIDGSTAINPDSASTVMFVDNEDTTSVLCGFTITGGSGVYNTTTTAQLGGGICGFNSGAKIINNIISGNNIEGDDNAIGAGIGFLTASGSHWVIIENNKIAQNQAYCNSGVVSMGGGIFISIYAKINNNIIEYNSCICIDCQANGAGIGCNSFFSNDGIVLLNNNSISHNISDGYNGFGGGLIMMRYMGYINGNNISYNSHTIDRYWGVGAFIDIPSGKLVITGNTFNNNTAGCYTTVGAGGGLCVRDAFEEQVVIDRNLFTYNVAKHGGGFYARNSYNMVLSNNLFSGDSAQIGGGIGLYHSETDKLSKTKGLSIPLIVNNTFFNNHVNESGGGVRLTGDAGVDLVTFNNIFYANESSFGNDIFNNSSAELVWVFSSNIDEDNISGQWDGNYNFAGFPYFTDDLCHIDCATPSPCINAGIHELEIGGIIYQAPELDFDGEIRPFDGLFDIGADEQELCTFISELNPLEYEFRLQVNPNPSSGMVHLQYSIPGNPVSSIQYPVSIIEVYSVDGVKVKTLKQGVLQSGEHEQTIDLSDLPDGMYFVRLQAGNQVETAKVVLMK